MRDPAGPGRRPRIYGEIVTLLAAEGDFVSILQLEHLWNTVAGEVPFTLVCGYFAEHFGAPRSSEALRRATSVRRRAMTSGPTRKHR